MVSLQCWSLGNFASSHINTGVTASPWANLGRGSGCCTVKWHPIFKKRQAFYGPVHRAGNRHRPAFSWARNYERSGPQKHDTFAPVLRCAIDPGWACSHLYHHFRCVTPADVLKFPSCIWSPEASHHPGTQAWGYPAGGRRRAGPCTIWLSRRWSGMALDLAVCGAMDMGVAGAAVATVISQVVSAVLCIIKAGPV